MEFQKCKRQKEFLERHKSWYRQQALRSCKSIRASVQPLDQVSFDGRSQLGNIFIRISGQVVQNAKKKTKITKKHSKQNKNDGHKWYYSTSPKLFKIW